MIKIIKILVINIVILLVLIVGLELVIHIADPSSNASDMGAFEPKILNERYVYTYRPNLQINQPWGYSSYKLITNSIGMRDLLNRKVIKITDRKRILFIGDSFTDPVGISFEDSFVGQFSKAYPGIDVLNAAVTSYSPSVYYEKIKAIIEDGIKFDEVIVYVDSSDIQDEAIIYHRDINGKLLKNPAPECSNISMPSYPNSIFLTSWYQRGFLSKSYILKIIRKSILTHDLKKYTESLVLSDFQQPGLAYDRDYGRVAWAYNNAPNCFDGSSAQQGVSKAIIEMEKLSNFLRARNIKLSIGVYPWPHHILYDVVDSEAVKIWKNFCIDKCERFFNHFPDFFLTHEDKPNLIRKFYIWGDVHFNKDGHLKLAYKLISEYSTP